MNDINRGRIYKVVLTSVSMLMLFPYIIISIYSRPCVDDFSYSATLFRYIQDGNWNWIQLIKKAIESDITFYNNWQGLYTSAFVLSLQPGIFGEKFYFIGSLLLMTLMYGCIYYVVKEIRNKFKFEFPVYLISIISLLYSVNGFPSLVQGLYWFNGAWNYLPFFFLDLVNWTMITKYIEQKKKRLVVLSVLLSFIISGGNHVTSFLNILVLAVIIVYCIYEKKDVICATLSLISAVVGFVIMYLAPGTAVRQSAQQSQSIVNTMRQSLRHCIEVSQNWICVQSICLMIVAVMMGVAIYKKGNYVLKINPLIIMAISCMLLCGEMCTPYYALGLFGSGRIQNIYWLTFSVLLVINTIYITIYLLDKIKFTYTANLKPIYSLIFWMIFIVLISLNSRSNMLLATKELIDGTAKQYAEDFDERVRICEEDTTGLIEVTPLTESIVLKFDDVIEDPQDWRNQAWKEYYNIDIMITY